jgi:hypothetical protein
MSRFDSVCVREDMERNESLNGCVAAEVRRIIGQVFYTVNREMGHHKPEQQSDMSQQVSCS